MPDTRGGLPAIHIVALPIEIGDQSLIRVFTYFKTICIEPQNILARSTSLPAINSLTIQLFSLSTPLPINFFAFFPTPDDDPTSIS
jgi:hypothetical protein